MSQSYSPNEEQDYTYTPSSQYGISQPSLHSYSTHLLSPYSQTSSVSSEGSHLGPHYATSHAVYSQTQQHSQLTHSYPYPTQYLAQSRYPTSHRYLAFPDQLRDVEIERQESCNELSMASEPVLPPLEGFPDVVEFDQLVASYVQDLSVKKQDKALIHSRRARNIKTVLIDPKNTAVESAQFRFWVKKMFKLEPNDGRTPESKRLICHEGKPVAIREKLFKILTRAHQQCQHGGRDKTSAQVRRMYSWVPKELISRFVKICPTCQVRRGGSRLTPPNSRRCSPKLTTLPNPQLLSPPGSRRDSVINRPGAVNGRSQNEYSSHIQGSSWGQGNSHNGHGSHHHLHHSSQYQHHVNPLAPTGLGTLPRSISSSMEGIPSGGMHLPHLDYHPTYEEANGIPDSQY
ncbi:predicted protein [Histoplasma mississippiense (nom. inval.)]|uniref:predicted protein n=1 Tax=Ajellomyces capsulatus (strain NAm1 / WU24) TaxID=2059318 RepID=UPI000157CA86|nr:predicted protein [Histoplasma mississippiense (nom. inval.)]EDN09755.1 predicted protein [Histoplasma mississippiense (nom. inval.)]